MFYKFIKRKVERSAKLVSCIRTRRALQVLWRTNNVFYCASPAHTTRALCWHTDTSFTQSFLNSVTSQDSTVANSHVMTFMYSECAGVPAVRVRAARCGDARVAVLPELSAGARRVPLRESAPSEYALAGDARRGERRDPRHLLHRPVRTRTRTRLLVQFHLSL